MRIADTLPVSVESKVKVPLCAGFKKGWRREWDSNPRYPFE